MSTSDRPYIRSSTPPDSDLLPARIVVADDDRLGRENLAGLLRAAGFTVEAVEDGQEALERVSQGGVDLVLLDIVMPRLSGFDACRLLKGMTADGFLPVMLVTSKTDISSRVEGLKIGADDYVCKPFEEQELLARINAMLRIKRMHDQVATQRAKLERLSVHDELTGLYNYRYLHTRLAEEFKRAERYREPFACLVIEVDNLKSFNELGGRGLSNALLVTVATTIRRCVREVDVVARYGGEDFLLVLPSTHFAGSMSLGERIWSEVMEHGTEYNGRVHKITVSVGIALYPSPDVRTKDALLRAADMALQQAKREGGNRICAFHQQGHIYTPEIGIAAAAATISSRFVPDPSASDRVDSSRGSKLAASMSAGVSASERGASERVDSTRGSRPTMPAVMDRGTDGTGRKP